MDEDVFIKSDIGAQAAWKGFSSQTLYIAYRLVTDTLQITSIHWMTFK